MATILNVINGISQVMANSHDGAMDAEGEPLSTGAKREEGNPLTDSRVIDGFSVKFHGNLLCVTYQVDVKLKEVHDSTFESDIEQTVNDLVSFIKKEYRKVTGSALTLKEKGEIEILVQYLSRVRTTVIAKKDYEIGGEGVDTVSAESEDRLDDTFKKFLELGKNGGRPKNDKSKSDNYKQFDPFNMETGQRNSNLK